MPKLSEYLTRASGTKATASPSGSCNNLVAARTVPHPAPTPRAVPFHSEVPTASSAATPSPQQLAGGLGQASDPSSSPSAAVQQQLHDRHVEQYRRRLRDRGPRTYRHPDGSLRPEPPAADFYTRANRVHWSELVTHARTHGGDREYDTHGFSLRYGLGVPKDAHRRLCEALDLREELLLPPPVGEYEGDPLADPAHPFNREWKQLADQVFAAAPHPWRYAGTQPVA